MKIKGPKLEQNSIQFRYKIKLNEHNHINYRVYSSIPCIPFWFPEMDNWHSVIIDSKETNHEFISRAVRVAEDKVAAIMAQYRAREEMKELMLKVPSVTDRLKNE